MLDSVLTWQYAPIASAIIDNLIASYDIGSLFSLFDVNHEMRSVIVSKLKQLNKDYWRRICQSNPSVEFILTFKEHILWGEKQTYFNLVKESNVDELITYFDWKVVSYISDISDNFLERYKEYLHWNIMLYCQNLSETQIRKFEHRINFGLVCYYKVLSDDFLEYYDSRGMINWTSISFNIDLTAEFLDNYWEKLDMDVISFRVQSEDLQLPQRILQFFDLEE